MANVTSTDQIADALGAWYNPLLQDIAVAKLIHNQFGDKVSMPKGNGKDVIYSRFEELNEATSELSETEDPEGQTMVVTRMKVTLKEYGDAVHLTNDVVMTVRDPTMNATTMRLGEQAGRTLDTLTLDVLVSTGSLYQCQYGGNQNAITEYSEEDNDEIVDRLLNNDANMFDGIMEGSTKFGTTPLDESYYSMTHTKMYKDLKKLHSWTPINQYPDPGARKLGERGYTSNIRWSLTSKGSVDTSGPYDIYDFITCGTHAYGVLDMEWEKFSEPSNGQNNMDSTNSVRPVEIIYTPPGGHGDKLKRKHILAWKAYHASRVLQDNWLIRGRASLA